MSYGEGEVISGVTLQAAFNTAFETAVGLGMSAFASSGDSGAAVNNGNGATSATDGISISGWANSQYVTAVGGSDFTDEFCGDITCANFVGPASGYFNTYNNVWYGSARSYVPEIPWGDSCATVMLSTLLGTTVPPVGASSECNVSSTFRTTGGGSGGPSGCYTGAVTTTSVVSGSCKGYPKPTFQANVVGTLPGMPNDQVRDVPDISAFAANGLSGHLLPACFSGTYSGAGGYTCGTVASPTRPINAANTVYWWIGGGTSFASPITAGAWALINQYKNGPQGNPNNRLYTLANSGGPVNSGPYGSSVSNCNAMLGYDINSGCIFHDPTVGDMDVNCTGAHNCYIPSSTRGVLNTGAITAVTTQPTCTGCNTSTTFSCSVAGPSNVGPYYTINGATQLYAGGVNATCSVSSTSGSVLTLTITAGGAGYATLPLSTVAITGGPGTITAQPVLTSTVSATTGYQPAFTTNPGYDLATGIGSINAYNLVHNY
jgi:subtilase family serine protease